MKLRLSRRADRAGTMAALTVLVVALFYLFNTVLLSLADTYGWYFYTAEQYDLSVSGAADPLLSDIDTSEHKVEIIFCQTEGNVEKDTQLDYVYETAVGLRDRYPDLIELRFVNLWLEPARLEPYRQTEDGEERTITKSSVIVDYGGSYLHNTASSFYVLDQSSYVTAYCGEETFIANILWVTASEHPVAYFTANHGEEIPAGLYRTLTYAGYRVDRLDLSQVTAVPEDAGLLIIFSPVYDFQRAAEGSTYVSELKKLESYLAAGGNLFVTLDPGRVAGLPRLTEFLATYGLGVEEGTLSDATNALPGSSGYALLAEYGDGTLATRLLDLASAGGRRTVLARCAALSLAPAAGVESEVLMTAPSSAVLLDAAGNRLSGGALPILTHSRLSSGGRILLAGSAYLAPNDILFSEHYGNKALLYALLDECFGATPPTGVPTVAIDRSAIENLTLGEANLFAALTCAVFPAALLIGGAVYCRRRKNH